MESSKSLTRHANTVHGAMMFKHGHTFPPHQRFTADSNPGQRRVILITCRACLSAENADYHKFTSLIKFVELTVYKLSWDHKIKSVFAMLLHGSEIRG